MTIWPALWDDDVEAAVLGDDSADASIDGFVRENV
jgi:hypothetical protein